MNTLTCDTPARDRLHLFAALFSEQRWPSNNFDLLYCRNSRCHTRSQLSIIDNGHDENLFRESFLIIETVDGSLIMLSHGTTLFDKSEADMISVFLKDA